MKGPFTSKPRRVCRSAFYGTVILSLFGCSVHAQSTPGDKVSKAEQGLVYDQAMHILGGNANVIARWVDSIRVRIIGAASQESETMVRAIVSEIADITDLEIDFVDAPFASSAAYLAAVRESPRFQLNHCAMESADELRESQHSCANFIIVISDIPTMQSLAEAIPLRPVYQQALANSDAVRCFFSPHQNRVKEIEQALVFVRSTLAAPMLKTCLYEEIYQSFGMFNDYSGSTLFSFNNRVEPKAISPYDKALLKSIYDSEIATGAPVFKVVQKMMDNLGFDPFNR